jgi:hypothetical protein
MKLTLNSLANSYRSYRAALKKRPLFKVLSYVPWLLVVSYLLLLCFPQVIYGNEMLYKNMTISSRGPVDESIRTVLDKVEVRLATSPLNDSGVRPRIVFTGNSRHYAMLSLYIGGNSFGKGYALLPTQNVFINRADYQHDLVFRNAKENNQRSLSGVIAHEITHLLIRKRFGYLRNLTMPTWKKEGYAEYVGGGSTLSYDEGVRLWKANPKDATGYQYFKYMMLVKYLLEHDKVSVDDLFNRDFDVQVLEERVLKSL